MATVQSVVCDECGRQKQEVNHWYVYFHSDDPEVNKLGFVVMPDAAVIEAEKAGVPIDSLRKDYCSQRCVTTIFQRWLDTGNVDKPQVVHRDPVEVVEVADEEAESK